MKHIVKAAYKDALHHLRKDMVHRMAGIKNPEDEEDPAEEAGESPMEEAAEQTEGGEMGEHPDHDMPLSDEEKREAMYGKRPMKKPGGVMVVIGVGKGKGKNARR